VRASPTKSYHSPVKCSPVRHSHHSPVRCSPVKCPCSPCSVYPCRFPSSCCVSFCCPVRSSPSKKPILHLHEED
jgi:hypothetical protein